MDDLLLLQKIDRTDPTPKYLQAQRILVDAIRSGRLAPGARLPATREFGALVDVSLITAHKALEKLVESGWLRREVGRGTYVREDVDLSAPSGRHLAIAILLDQHVNIGDYYHSAILEGLRQEARADTHRVEFFFQGRPVLQARGRNGDVGAIWIHPPLESQADVERLARHYPAVVLGGAFPASEVAFVDCDNHHGARAAVRHLIELGHRRFLVLSGPMNLTNSRDRAEGATDELAARGIGLDPRDRPVSSDSVLVDEETRTHLHQRLTATDRPTAIVAGGFYLALATMQIARAAGLSVPRDLSIVGFDDPASAPLLDPPLTTVRQPLNQMASKAYQLVRQAMLGRRAGLSSCKLPRALCVGGAPGPAP
jgi:GntR family transcriptional regulator of arabinose operon